LSYTRKSHRPPTDPESGSGIVSRRATEKRYTQSAIRLPDANIAGGVPFAPANKTEAKK